MYCGNACLLPAPSVCAIEGARLSHLLGLGLGRSGVWDSAALMVAFSIATVCRNIVERLVSRSDLLAEYGLHFRFGTVFLCYLVD